MLPPACRRRTPVPARNHRAGANWNAAQKLGSVPRSAKPVSNMPAPTDEPLHVVLNEIIACRAEFVSSQGFSAQCRAGGSFASTDTRWRMFEKVRSRASDATARTSATRVL
jgi:hypothetical protein